MARTSALIFVSCLAAFIQDTTALPIPRVPHSFSDQALLQPASPTTNAQHPLFPQLPQPTNASSAEAPSATADTPSYNPIDSETNPSDPTSPLSITSKATLLRPRPGKGHGFATSTLRNPHQHSYHGIGRTVVWNPWTWSRALQGCGWRRYSHGVRSSEALTPGDGDGKQDAAKAIDARGGDGGQGVSKSGSASSGDETPAATTVTAAATVAEEEAGESLISDEKVQTQALMRVGEDTKAMIDPDEQSKRRIEQVRVQSVMLGAKLNGETGTDLITFERVSDVAFVTAVEA